MLPRILVTDDAQATSEDADLIVWIGPRPAPAHWRRRSLVERSSPRSAAIYLVSRRAELKLRLNDPLAFLDQLAEIRSLPALRAA
jgi:hypothetical protein